MGIRCSLPVRAVGVRAREGGEPAGSSFFIWEGLTMFTRSPSRPERPSFRPVLEALEGRELPSSLQAQVMGVITQLPNELRAVEVGLSVNNSAQVSAQLQRINSDASFLLSSAASFTSSSHFLIDQFVFNEGVQLFRDGFSSTARNTNLRSQVAVAGFDLAVLAFLDFRVAQRTPSGNLTL
jgi:hypothetical protein